MANKALNFDGISGEVTVADAASIQNIFDNGGTIECTPKIGENISVNMGGGMLPVKILEEITLDAPAASVTFSDIGTNKDLWDSLAGTESRHLVVMVNAKSPDAVAQRDVRMRVNGDTGNNYNFQYLSGENAVPAAGERDPQIRG